MDVEKLKLLVNDLENTLSILKEELYSSEDDYQIENISLLELDYDEVFDEDDYQD